MGVAAPASIPFLPDSWRRFLADTVEWDYEIDQLSRSREPNCLPVVEDRARAFRILRPDQVRVILLGQEPTPGQADGLAFSSRGCKALPASLERIFSNFATRPESSDLTFWAEQVMDQNLDLDRYRVSCY